MISTALDTTTLKVALKEALVETLHEQREFLQEVFAEVLEDVALADAIREGQATESAARDDVLSVLRGKA
jgi:hypothetical protein